MWILVHKSFLRLMMPNLEVLKMPKIWLRQIGILSPTKILGTKIHIYKRFPVDTGGHCTVHMGWKYWFSRNGAKLHSNMVHLMLIKDLKSKLNLTQPLHCEHGVEIEKMQILCECILYWKSMHFLTVIVQNWSEYRHRSAKVAISKSLKLILNVH